MHWSIEAWQPCVHSLGVFACCHIIGCKYKKSTWSCGGLCSSVSSTEYIACSVFTSGSLARKATLRLQDSACQDALPVWPCASCSTSQISRQGLLQQLEDIRGMPQMIELSQKIEHKLVYKEQFHLSSSSGNMLLLKIMSLTIATF